SDNRTVLLNGTVIALTPSKDTAAGRNVSHTITRATDLPIGGLTDGVTYYVHLDSSDPNNKFQLTATPGGSIITLNATGLTGTHRIGTEGVDLSANGTSVGNFALYLDLQTVGSGTQHLLGPGGVPLGNLLGSGGDGTSSATAEGAGGAIVIEVSVPKGTLTQSPTVDAYIGSAPDSSGNAT